MADPKQVELARQQILSQPAVAEAMGLSADTVADPEQWAKLMQDGVLSNI